jgi:hypothetical protein
VVGQAVRFGELAPEHPIRRTTARRIAGAIDANRALLAA